MIHQGFYTWLLGVCCCSCFFSVKFISYLKRRKNNIPLWSSIFVGITMGLVNLDIHIEPSTQIERKAKRNGKDELSNDFIDPESIKISKIDWHTTVVIISAASRFFLDLIAGLWSSPILRWIMRFSRLNVYLGTVSIFAYCTLAAVTFSGYEPPSLTLSRAVLDVPVAGTWFSALPRLNRDILL